MRIEDTYRLKRQHKPIELKFLKDMVSKVADKEAAIVNVGVYYGASSAALLVGMHEYGITGPLYCIDVFRYHNAGKPKTKPFRERTDVPWSADFINQVKENLTPFVGETEVNYAQCFSDDFDLSVVEDISLIFIDADHTTQGCLLDALKFSQKVVPGGFMLFHDFTAFKSVKKAVSMFIKIRPDFKLKSVQYSIAVLKKDG